MYIREFYQILFKNQFHFLCILWLILRTLSDVLYHGGNSAVCRQQAGVQLKNFLYTNDESLRAQYEERWLNIPEDVRQYTKQNVVGALGTESFRPSAAAQCIHMIAVVELPRGCWPGKWHLLKIKKTADMHQKLELQRKLFEDYDDFYDCPLFALLIIAFLS